MSIDMSQFYQVFFDEAAEHLVSMESLLLALDLDAPDADQLNAIFRAAHSIKGGSGTFGFTDMADVTHVLETLLDRIRKNEIPLTHDMVDAFLQAGDVLRGLLEAHQHGNIADESRSIAICARLEQLAENQSGVHGQKAGDKGQGKTAAGSSQALALHTYQIQFANTRTAFPSKAHLNNLLEELSNTGKVKNQKITAASVKLTLITQSSEAKLREIFAFFLDPQQLTITEVGGKPDSDAEQGYGFFVGTEQISGAAAAPADTEGYGFFAEPEVIKSGVEKAEGYGFFKAPETIKSEAENVQGYGFFNDAGNRVTAPAYLFDRTE